MNHILKKLNENRNKDNLKKFYHSEIYSINSNFPNGRKIINLGSFSKEDIKKELPEFLENLPGRSYNSPFLDKDYFYEDKNRHQFYSFLTELDNNKLLNINFRTKSEDNLTDKSLENMQDSMIIRTKTLNHGLDSKLSDKNLEILDKISNDYGLLDSNEQEMKYMQGEIKTEYIKEKSSIILDTLNLMESQGHNANEIIHNLDNLKIFPLIRCSDDLIINKIKDLISY
jgi:hypothetical protein